MPQRVDAHLHFFQPGYAAELPPSCRRMQPDEVTLYAALAQQHGVTHALAVGYEGVPWATGNNRYLAQLAATHAWIHPLAFVSDPAQLNVAQLEQLARNHFAGVSVYVFDDQLRAALALVPADVWHWLAQHRWLISVNSRGEHWRAWTAILAHHPELRVLVSHAGLPPAVRHAPDAHDAQAALGTVLALAQFSGVHVKLSGFYALAMPGYDYPHRAAWPYVEQLLEAFGSKRLLWGSDFSPSLEWLSFPQTWSLFAQMPFLTAADRQQIEGDNLRQLLAERA